MAARRHVAEAAQALRRHARSAVEYHARSSSYAQVIAVDPLAVALHGSDEVLDDSQLSLTQWVKRYDLDHTIDVGDTLVIHEMPNGDWLATDVVSDKGLA